MQGFAADESTTVATQKDTTIWPVGYCGDWHKCWIIIFVSSLHKHVPISGVRKIECKGPVGEGVILKQQMVTMTWQERQTPLAVDIWYVKSYKNWINPLNKTNSYAKVLASSGAG